jgi:ribosomal-protein-alanine N-acetyltransferase
MTAGLEFQRLTASDDLAQVLDIDRESFSTPWSREMYERDLEHAHAYLIVARRAGGTAAGYCSFWLVIDEVHINNVAVRKSYRRQGIGRALVDHVLELGQALGARSATLEVRSANVAARDLYASAGFRERGIRRRYYSNPEDDAVVMWAEIQIVGTAPAS